MTQPKIRDIVNDDNILKFTLSNVNVSIANAIRRTVLSDIPTVVFKTTPQEENHAQIITNTSRLNNEILKQRLSCIPICISNAQDQLKFISDYMLELNVENNLKKLNEINIQLFSEKITELQNQLSSLIKKKDVSVAKSKKHIVEKIRRSSRLKKN